MSDTSNAQALHVVGIIPVGEKPVGLAADGNNQVFVTNSGDNTVSVINTATDTVKKTVQVGIAPQSVAIDPQFGTYVANGGGAISVIDRSNTVTGTIATGVPPAPPPDTTRVAVDHFASRAYATLRTADRIAVIHTSSTPPHLGGFIDVPGPLGVALHPFHHHLYVTRPDFDTVSVLAPETGEFPLTIPVGRRPTGIAIDHERGRVYVANSGSHTVSVIDTTTGGVHDVDVLAPPIAVALDPRGDAYVSHADGTLRIIDAASHSVTATVPVGSAAVAGVAYESHSMHVYVANGADGTVSVLDLAGG
ncbi:YncE family protein [Streptomyces sp. SP17KL33]|uniref:YncE family protein n=1 Tax=Streptomyces sp. SP17KL33 TaxID=3002534 RepID=UPI002E7A6620|nr:YncE family protein [Streptomyces sp. SP17KL33]MEE1829381.1 YncE family protein [Streptomyces sp. SP17KL33]